MCRQSATYRDFRVHPPQRRPHARVCCIAQSGAASCADYTDPDLIMSVTGVRHEYCSTRDVNPSR